MGYYAKYFFAFILVVAVFLTIRKWIDRKREKLQDIDIVRSDMDEGDAHLGSWAQKNDSALIWLRLKRDGRFICEIIGLAAHDTVRYKGLHQMITATGRDRGVYPKLIAISDAGDTVINHFVHLSRATQKNVDILELQKQNNLGAPAMLFYRIEQ